MCEKRLELPTTGRGKGSQGVGVGGSLREGKEGTTFRNWHRKEMLATNKAEGTHCRRSRRKDEEAATWPNTFCGFSYTLVFSIFPFPFPSPPAICHLFLARGKRAS